MMHVQLLREYRAYTRKAVAAGTGISAVAYSEIEKGYRVPTEEQRQRIAVFLCYPESEIDFRRPKPLKEYA